MSETQKALPEPVIYTSSGLTTKERDAKKELIEEMEKMDMPRIRMEVVYKYFKVLDESLLGSIDRFEFNSDEIEYLFTLLEKRFRMFRTETFLQLRQQIQGLEGKQDASPTADPEDEGQIEYGAHLSDTPDHVSHFG